MPSSRRTWQRFQSFCTMSCVVAIRIPFRSGGVPPDLVLDVTEDGFQLPLEHAVDPSETAVLAELARVHRAAVHHPLALHLRADAPQPVALRPRPCPRGE